ncbi:hypothetical protein [Clostridium sp. OS1-26]|nr:hypothetical protein [Clostridium sp. OS1-26]WML35328.1 hypothetical protein RCG18_00755 [Clostridium sp. OS1-26]
MKLINHYERIENDPSSNSHRFVFKIASYNNSFLHTFLISVINKIEEPAS